MKRESLHDRLAAQWGVDAVQEPTQQATPVDISDMGVLSDTLRAKEPTIGELCEHAADILNRGGAETTVNNISGFATKQSYKVVLDKQPLYARLACKLDKDGTPNGPLSVIFCKGSDFSNIRTNNDYFSALTFDSSGNHLVAGTGRDPVTDDPKTIQLVTTLVGKLSEELHKDEEAGRTARAKAEAAERKATEVAAQEAAKQEIEEKWERYLRHNRRVHRSKVAAAWLIVAALSYAPEIVDTAIGQHVDVPTIGSVPIFPYEVEMFVDGNNAPDHTAQGFSRPAGALAISAGEPTVSLPLLPEYNTKGVPNASMNDGLGNYDGELSKPGLYVSDFSTKPKAGNDYFDGDYGKNNCYPIDGDFREGKTSVFTETPGLDKIVSLSVVNVTTLNVCKLPNVPKNAGGTIYLYQKH